MKPNTYPKTEKLIEKVKDKELKGYLKRYIRHRSPTELTEILRYFNTYIDLDYYERIVTLFDVTGVGILLGVLDRDGTAELDFLRLHGDFYVLSTFEVGYRDVRAFWRERGTVYEVEKINTVYRCNDGFETTDFKEFTGHFLGHKETASRFDQVMDEMRVTEKEKELVKKTAEGVLKFLLLYSPE